VPAVELYRASFKPSEVLQRPYVMLGTAMVAADDDAEAEFLNGPNVLQFLRLRQGRPGLLPTPEEAERALKDPSARQFAEQRRASQIVGGPEAVRRGVEELLAKTNADELMVTSVVHDHAARKRSYELLADVVDLAPRERRGAAVA
jgi:alkanesulfonate monooxygenase SsuD/methylene tetrahydromethanopterin reductase-like flavin-dependent oxidoreductase (luciferase family)